MTVRTHRHALVPVAARMLDDGPVRLIRRDLHRLVGEPPRRGLTLDLSAVEAPTAAGLGGLVALDRRLRQAGQRLVLLNVGPRAMEVFRVTGLDAVLELQHGD
jgi:anti-anti-sigma factor